ncbi:MAG TPA: NAD(P)-dependent oxidoreductase [Streptosporangiaceae bacterium]|nr:NAD(P)-dependent oxidoreductase [Streptosporangiaceae bacterium]
MAAGAAGSRARGQDPPVVVALGAVDPALIEGVLGGHCRFVADPGKADLAAAAGAIVRADARVDRELLDRAPALRVLARTGGLGELAVRSDVITLHLPLDEQTRHLVGDAFLAQVKPGAILVNCGRGGLVDTDAVWRALTSGRLSGVGLDVFDPEPPAPHPLFSHPDVVLTPHLMGLSRRATAATFAAAAQGVLDVLGGREPQAVADPAWRTYAPKEIPA